MSPHLLDYYNRELQYLRESGHAFAERFPKVGSQLGLTGGDCSDPHVERLLEGVAFLSARVHLKIDAAFPTFVDGLVGLVAPHLAAPRPSAMIARFEPDADQPALADGVVVPRGTSLRTTVDGSATRVDFRTSRDITLWPIELQQVSYRSALSAEASAIPTFGDAGGWVELGFRTTAGIRTGGLAVDQLPLQLTGDAGQANRLFELLLAGTTRVVIRDDAAPDRFTTSDASLHPIGFDPEDTLCPPDPRVSRGHRLLSEYFLLPEKFRGLTLDGIGEAIRSLDTDRFSILLLTEFGDDLLSRRLTARDVRLYCVPATNIFPKRADRGRLHAGHRELHVVPDRSRPTDYEVWGIESVTGFSGQSLDRVPFAAAHGIAPGGRSDGATAKPFGLYAVERRERVASASSATPIADDLGTEVFLTFTDPCGGPLDESFRQIAVETLCTNRGLADRVDAGTTFGTNVALPVRRITAESRPTRPKRPLVFGGRESSWLFLSHLSLNYLSLVDEAGNAAPAALAELLRLYCDPGDRAMRREIEGLKSVVAQPIVSRLPMPGPLVYGRGLQIDVRCDEDCFAGSRSYLFASVLERFLSEFVSVNSFVRTRLQTQRGEIDQWPIRTGHRPVL